jgi:hypothetical protein
MRTLITGLAAMALAFGAGPALAAQDVPAADATAQAKPPTPEERIAELEAQLARQRLIADNARKELDALRADAKRKDELLVLGRARNAALYAIAEEIADRYVRRRSVDPFFQGRRVKMENLRQSYEDRLRAARITEATLPPSVQQRMDAELGAAPAQTPPAQQN